MIDLHLHSNVTKPNDSGDSAPRQIVEEAKRIGLYALALTDHDSIKGLPEAVKTANELGIKFVPGVEISCNFDGVDIEVIALGIDYKKMNSYLEKSKKQMISEKNDFVRRTAKRCQEYDIEIPSIRFSTHDVFVDELSMVVHESYELEKNRVICQKISGQYPQTEKEYYKKLFAPGKPCRVVKDLKPLKEAIKVTRDSGGKSFLAHPKRIDGNVAYLSDEHIEKAVSLGLDGIECICPKIMTKDRVALMDFCKSKNLLMSGGSDSHALTAMETLSKKLNVPNSFINWFFD